MGKFYFSSKEEETKELKSHKLEAGPSRPSRDLIRYVSILISTLTYASFLIDLKIDQ